jgi:type I restriction enzyme S subunit
LKLVPVEQPELDRLRLHAGDVLFVRTNGNPDYVGRCAVFNPLEIEKRGHDPSDWIFASYLIRARAKREKVNPIYLREFLSTSEGRKALRERSKTSAGQFNINTEGLGSIPIPLPSIEHQDEYARCVTSIEPLKEKQESSLAKLEKLFLSLQYQAFKGEL